MRCTFALLVVMFFFPSRSVCQIAEKTDSQVEAEELKREFLRHQKLTLATFKALDAKIEKHIDAQEGNTAKIEKLRLVQQELEREFLRNQNLTLTTFKQLTALVEQRRTAQTAQPNFKLDEQEDLRADLKRFNDEFEADMKRRREQRTSPPHKRPR